MAKKKTKKPKLAKKASKAKTTEDRKTTAPGAEGKKAAGKARGSATAGTGTSDESKALPQPRGTAADVRTLQALIDRLPATIAESMRNELRQHEQRVAQATAPAPPSAHDATFARLPEFMSETEARLTRIESAHQQTARAPSLDLPASVSALRRFFAGACKTLAIHRPTPAIIGRVMHDERVFERSAAKSPYMIFNSIYTTVRRVFGLQPPPPESSNQEIDHVHLTTDMVELMEGRSSRPADKHAGHYDNQLKPRLALLVNSKLAHVEENQQGKRKNYFRYLTPQGRELFNGWPEWTDRTGGISLADEEPSLPASPNATCPSEPPTPPTAPGPTFPAT